MLTLPIAGQRIHRELSELEQTLNIAMTQAAALMQSCAAARNLPEIAATTGQPVLLRLSSITQHLVQSGGDVARIHGDLLALNEFYEVMMPDQGGACPNPMTTAISAAA